ncbi:helix-turn-helix transcriptional regulator [Micromonospora zhanjiangensis]|uniref:Helix-turn-helix transcriptional regulator n=1 Tax=Micromonospora zhanjiangensis TaxID=1522057 RepID=A0ABV8KV33_9ACTN
MKVQVFTVVLDHPPTDDEIDALFEAGCDDAAFGVDHGVATAQFDRKAATLADAIASAVRAIESAGLTAVRVVDEDLLTLADISDRIGQSRESVRRYATGARGPGGFPPPVNPSREGASFYRWSEVAPWIREHIGLDVPDIDPALVVANLVLQARQHRNKVAHLSALTDLLAA